MRIVDHRPRGSLAIAFVILSTLLVTTRARAETWQAPVGGRAIALAEGRVACSVASGDWTIEAAGAAVRPPVTEDAVGRSTELRIAPTAAACATTATTVTLVATGRWPTIDTAATTLSPDDARVELRGRGLRGVIVQWRAGDRSGEDRCAQPQSEGAVEKCALGVGRGLTADPTAVTLAWFPAGARVGADVVTFDAAARKVAREELVLRPARVVVSSLVPAGTAIDLASGGVGRIPLVHPEAVASAECGAAACEISGGAVVVHDIKSIGTALSLRLRLLPRVFLQRGDALDAAPTLSVPVLPCGMSIASGDAPRAIDDSRIVVRVDARCAGEARAMRFFAGGRAADVVAVEESGGAGFVLLRVGRVEGDELVVTATRSGADGSTIGQARARTRALAAPRAVLALASGVTLDFIPTNRTANVRFAQPAEGGRFALSPVEGVYEANEHDGATTIRGERASAGFVALRFAYRVPSLPGSLATTALATLVEAIERPLHEANIPVALGASALGPKPIVELVCSADGRAPKTIAPGDVTHIPFSARDSCRVVFHRDRLSPEDGAQYLSLDIDVARVDGAARPEAHISQSIVLRAGAEPRYAWLKGIVGAFDRAVVRISHVGDESHYVGGAELRNGAPSAQWSVVFGTGHARIYATTAIPTGLYRVSDADHSGILALNFGVVMRGTWLDDQGHEGFLGLEAGVMGVGLANDVSRSGHSLTQLATVAGIGLSVPIANRSLATETSINLHAWLEYEVSRTGDVPGNAIGFVFGPSISIGNVGTSF